MSIHVIYYKVRRPHTGTTFHSYLYFSYICYNKLIIMELSPHLALESFLHMANRLEVRDAWHCLLLRKEFENTGPHSLCNHEEILGLLRETRLSQSGSTSAGEYTTIKLDCGVNFRPSHIILDVIDGESHIVNIVYYTKATGHVSIQTNLVDIKAKLECHIKPIILNRIGEQYGI